MKKEWLDYYDRFPYFSTENIRPGCHPVVFEHNETPKNALVLTHGLSDSPYYMKYIARYFFEELGYNVYLPLLHCHGLKNPEGMESVSLDEWKANVRFGVETAAEKCDVVSAGGFSTGALLSLHAGYHQTDINGTLFLFSAALDIAGGRFGLIGEIKERILRSFLADLFDSNKPLIAKNPYKYSHIDIDAGQELSFLIKETDKLVSNLNDKNQFPNEVFIAHSESDTTASIEGVEWLSKKLSPERHSFFRIQKEFGVLHPSSILQKPLVVNGNTLNDANPLFNDMMEAVKEIVL